MLMLPFYKKVSYGMGRFGSSVLLGIVGFLAFYFYGTVISLNWFLSGLAVGLSYVVIGVFSWLIGFYSDSVNTRWGRRKPFVIIGATGLAVTCLLIFVPNWFFNTAAYAADPESNVMLGWMIFGYFLLSICAFKFFYAFLLTPFQAWMPEITEESERPLVSSMQNTSNWVANGLAIVFSLLSPVLLIVPSEGLAPLGLMIVLVFCIITVVFYLPSIVFVREKEGIEPPKRSIRDETIEVLRNSIYVKWFMILGFLSFAFTAITQQIVGYSKLVMQLDTLDTLIPAALALLVSVLVFFYVWIKVIHRYGKGSSLFYSLLVLAVLLCLTPFVPNLIGILPKVTVAVIYYVPLAASMCVYYIMSYVVPADIAHVDLLDSGKGRAGMYEGFKGLPLNLFQAAASILLGWFMAFSQSTTGSPLYGYLGWGPFFAPFLIVAALILTRTNIDPDFDRLREERGTAVDGQSGAQLE